MWYCMDVIDGKNVDEELYQGRTSLQVVVWKKMIWHTQLKHAGHAKIAARVAWDAQVV